MTRDRQTEQPSPTQTAAGLRRRCSPGAGPWVRRHPECPSYARYRAHERHRRFVNDPS